VSGEAADDDDDRLHPFVLFLTFLDRTGWSYSLLLDFVMSPETCFLLYLVRTLKNIAGCWQLWTEVCRNYVAPPAERTTKENDSRTGQCDRAANGGDRPASTESWPGDGKATHAGQTGMAATRGNDNVDLDTLLKGERGRAGLRDARVGQRKRKYETVDVSALDALEPDNESQDAEVVEHVEHILPACCRVSSTADIEVRHVAIVDYSSSSDEEEFNSPHVPPTSARNSSSQVLPADTTRSKAVVNNWPVDRRDFVTSPDGQKDETLSLVSRSDEGLMGNCCSEAGENSRSTTLHRAVAVLSELRRVVSRLVARNVFPFNVQPLIRHLRRCEVLYAGNEDMM